jgi:predicted CoA-binding protein
MTNTLTSIQSFLAEPRFAMIGVPRNPKEFSAHLFSEFVSRGYDVVPVNPATQELAGRRAYAHVTDVRPPVSAALVMTPRKLDLEILEECVQAKVRLAWLYGVKGPKDIDPKAIEFCHAHGIELIAGYCPFMFLPKAAFYHKFHGGVARVFGTYPH